MSTTTSDPQTVAFDELVEDLIPPCELRERGPVDCGPAPAKWIMHMICPDCGITGVRLACDTCKDNRMTLPDTWSIRCPNGCMIQPPRKAYRLIEAL